MEPLKFTANEIRYIALFEKMTGAAMKDCIVDDEENKIIFLVKKGQMGIAIGKKGENIKKVRQALGKKIEVIEYSEDPAEFIKNSFNPFRINDVSITGKAEKKVAKVDIDDRDRMTAIGRGGKNIQKVKMLVSRHHNIGDVIII